MKTKDLKVGERIALKLELSDGTISSSSFTSKIEDISQSTLLISSPSSGDAQNWVGKTLEITVPRDYSAYSCYSRVISQKVEGNIFIVEVKVLTDFIRVQRRNFYRLKTELNVDLIGIGSVKSIDLSGNGIALKMTQSIEPDTVIEGVIYIFKTPLNFKGHVVRTQSYVHYDGGAYNLIGVEFIDLEPCSQNTILKFIHSEQLIMIHKGIM